jgi:tetratricopeptide (TPR) repeat protein
VLVGVPLLIVLACEVGLRLAGVGFDPSVTIPCEVQGVPCRADNPRYSWQFFPPAIARQFEPFTFPVSRPAKSYRIVVLGESAAQGVPDGAFAFARVLREMLQAAYPDVQFEVIKAGMTAINSHVIYQIGKDLLRYNPDLVVVYMGNNEVIGPFGIGTVFGPFSRHISLIRFGIELRKTRLGQCIARLSQRNQNKLLASWGGMQMFLDKQVRPTDPDLQIVYGHFRDNLTDLCTAATDAGTKVVVCTVASNLRDCPPFASLHKSDLTQQGLTEWQDLYEKGCQLETEGRYDQALSCYRQAQALDDQFAALAFRLARCLDRTGQYDQAGRQYDQARELDGLRFRTDHRLNETIRQVAAKLASRGVSLVDVEKAFAEQSDQHIPGKGLFYEHVHMTFSGNTLLARTLFGPVGQEVAARFGLGRPATEPLSEEQCRLRLAYTDADRYILAKTIYNEFLLKPPFTSQVYHAEDVEQRRQELEQLKGFTSKAELARSAAAYEKAIAMDPSDWNLYWKLGNLLADHAAEQAKAEGAFKKVQQLAPTFHLGYTGLGQVYLRMDRCAEAAAQFEKSLRLYDAHPLTCFLLGSAYEKQKDLSRAAANYSRALSWQPGNSLVCSALGRVLRQQGRSQEAIAVLRKGTEACPSDALLHANLGLLLSESGDAAAAQLEVRTALQLDPNSEPIQRAAGRLLGRLGQ